PTDPAPSKAETRPGSPEISGKKRGGMRVGAPRTSVRSEVEHDSDLRNVLSAPDNARARSVNASILFEKNAVRNELSSADANGIRDFASSLARRSAIDAARIFRRGGRVRRAMGRSVSGASRSVGHS